MTVCSHETCQLPKKLSRVSRTPTLHKYKNFALKYAPQAVATTRRKLKKDVTSTEHAPTYHAKHIYKTVCRSIYLFYFLPT